MVEDPIEKDECIICGKETDRVWQVYPPHSPNIPMCGVCQATTILDKMVEAAKKYEERKNGKDIGRTIALEMKKREYEHYRGKDVQGAENRFFIKGRRLVQVIVEEDVDEEILESIRGG